MKSYLANELGVDGYVYIASEVDALLQQLLKRADKWEKEEDTPYESRRDGMMCAEELRAIIESKLVSIIAAHAPEPSVPVSELGKLGGYKPTYEGLLDLWFGLQRLIHAAEKGSKKV